MGNDLYQIGLPVASLSTVLMDWTCFNRPEKLLISPAKKDEWRWLNSGTRSWPQLSSRMCRRQW